MANKREENGRHFGGDSRGRLCPSSQVSLKLSQSSELSLIHDELSFIHDERQSYDERSHSVVLDIAVNL